MNSTHACWCGQTQLANFSSDYSLCENCQTLVVKNWPPPERFEVVDDATDFYGRSYYESHVTKDYGLPSLPERARTDLNERCMHWMRTVLKYHLPPARTLELGAAHGGFVALMGWAGFDATGLEISPSLVNYAKSTFGVPMLTGNVQDQSIEPGTLDLILLFDVLEHLPDPVSTLRHCITLLKPDGAVMIQTPSFPVGRTYQQMVDTQDRFVEQFKPSEHLYLFSESSVRRLFSDLGFPFVQFEPAIFDHYDMFLVASKQARTPHSPEKGTEELLRRPQGRVVQALLDANTQYNELAGRYRESEEDRRARLDLLEQADLRMKAIDSDLREANARIGTIDRQLMEIDAAYNQQMSHGLARLLRRLYGRLKIDPLYKTMDERIASGGKAAGTNGPH
jgi:2-polyprenyl-3-methyl-5-hydroxy-6-metoxy-1,4-benzoquinol methylase